MLSSAAAGQRKLCHNPEQSSACSTWSEDGSAALEPLGSGINRAARGQHSVPSRGARPTPWQVNHPLSPQPTPQPTFKARLTLSAPRKALPEVTDVQDGEKKLLIRLGGCGCSACGCFPPLAAPLVFLRSSQFLINLIGSSSHPTPCAPALGDCLTYDTQSGVF